MRQAARQRQEKERLLMQAASSRLNAIEAVTSAQQSVLDIRRQLPSTKALGAGSLGILGSWLIARHVLSGKDANKKQSANGLLAGSSRYDATQTRAKGGIMRFLILKGVLLFGWPYLKARLMEGGARMLVAQIGKSDVTQLVNRLLGRT